MLVIARALSQLAEQPPQGQAGMFRFGLDAQANRSKEFFWPRLFWKPGIPFALIHPRWSEQQRLKNAACLGDVEILGPGDAAIA